MVLKGIVTGISLGNRNTEFCMRCSKAKQTNRPQPTEGTSESACRCGDGIDLKTDLKPDRSGHKYVFTTIDYGASFSRVQLLKSKGETAKHIRQFITEFKRQFNLRVKCIWTDGGGEFMSTREAMASPVWHQ
ncbi:hypothetical protein PI125_g21290 [Phytophthora idaei]|nr:hypothetical protein PI125_g21290 [Phytophthora idaei]